MATSRREFGEFAILVSDLEGATGWVLKPEGLCKGDICYPVRNAGELSDGVNIDLASFAKLTNQNLVFDREYEVAALGDLAPTRAESMSSLGAPDFKLPDIHGKQVSFSDFNRRKRLLLAWSSW
ncbi:unannotated protein [freshwater metagenome]|uniref:Unannotated protein n=1 Tax=freshwater metagenome TaxID=449393 RepID=A0A6J6BG47_9ZZZZ|nr:hypothetical protein [Actinomycetota bacterium]MTA65702.1 hypothetical protein [Actinomycetota bacterium]